MTAGPRGTRGHRPTGPAPRTRRIAPATTIPAAPATCAGIVAYTSQFHILPDQVPAWFAGTVGDRFGAEAIQSAANARTDDELSLRDRSLIVIAALIAQGDLGTELRMHTRWALDHGATPVELDALAALLAIYTGFARASRGLMIIRDELSNPTRADALAARLSPATSLPVIVTAASTGVAKDRDRDVQGRAAGQVAEGPLTRTISDS